MKKSLIALAVLAASGAAMAQSSVTLYGVADAFVGQSKAGNLNTTTGAFQEVTQTVVGSSGYNSSRWGLKGTEDLGGGLKANFTLESGFNIDTGAQASATSLFNRQAFVGLSGGFGSVSLGNQYTAYDALRGASNQSFDSTVFGGMTAVVWGKTNSATNYVTGTTNQYNNSHSAVADYASRAANSIAYTSPVFGGFSGALVVGLGENKTDTVSASQNLSLHLKYANGPVLVGYAYQEEKAQNSKAAASAYTNSITGFANPAVVAAVATDTVTTKYNLIAGSYDFGMAKLTGGYNTAKINNAAGTQDKEYQLGVSVPVGAAASVALGYVNAKGEDNTGTLTKASGMSLTGYYDLSKRTRAYAGFMSTKGENATGVETVKTSLIAAGVRHSF